MVGFALLALIGCEPEDTATPRDCDERSFFYVDADGDGFGDSTQVVLACGASDGLSANPDDCDDTDSSRTTACDDTDTGDPDTADTGGSRSGTQDTDTDDTATGTTDTGPE